MSSKQDEDFVKMMAQGLLSYMVASAPERRLSFNQADLHRELTELSNKGLVMDIEFTDNGETLSFFYRPKLAKVEDKE